MLNIARLHTYSKTGEFFLIEVPRYEARLKKKELESRGMTVPHTELV